MSSALHYQRTVIGYHGCDQRTVASLFQKRQPLQASQNDYDWLGRGIYFWEYGRERAWDWAVERVRRQPDPGGKPAVLGAVIHLGHCFDLLDVRFTRYLRQMFSEFQDHVTERGWPMPVNRGIGLLPEDQILRRLDCAMLNWAVAHWENRESVLFDTIRAVFQEGEPAFPGSGIRFKSHIQISVRQPGVILGYFDPLIDAADSPRKLNS